MDRESIIEKIKKLLRMKRGGTAGEVQNALALAAGLARKHGIDLARVNPDEAQDSVGEMAFIMATQLSPEAKYAAAIVTKHFNVSLVAQPALNTITNRHVTKVFLVGEKWDCQIGAYIFGFIQHAMRSLWRSRENRRLRNRDAFLYGCFIGLASKLEDEHERHGVQGHELMIIGKSVQRRNEYIAKRFPNIEARDLEAEDSEAWAAKRAGALAGMNINLRRGLQPANTSPRPQLHEPEKQLALF